MTSHPSDRRRGRTPAALQAAALSTLLTFGCTTVRAPASTIATTVPVHGGMGEPQVELWLESAHVPGPGAPWEAPPAEPLAEIASVTLDPPHPLDPDTRGFFDGDWLRLELVVVDRHGGAVLWVKSVEADADARDAGAVRKLLDRALGDPSGWASPASDPGRPAPPSW